MAKELNKILSESVGLSEEIQTQITEAWNAKLAEARDELTTNLREEFAKKYTHDKNVLTEAMDNFLNDKLRIELEEFAIDKRKLIESRIAYKNKIKEHRILLNKFVTEQVVKEVKLLCEDRKNLSENFVKMEDFILSQLAEEIVEFRKDKQKLVEQRVKMVREGKNQLLETKRQFIGRASTIIESNINTLLNKELTQFKDDIKSARENEFGRRIFEAFVGEYLTSYLNEGTEVSKLQKVLTAKDQELSHINESIETQKQKINTLQSNVNVLKERIQRNRVLGEMLAPLNKEKRGVMSELLESVKTADLEKAYTKYLPSVLNEQVRPKAGRSTLTESKKIETGNRANSMDVDFNDELAQIKSLAGIK